MLDSEILKDYPQLYANFYGEDGSMRTTMYRKGESPDPQGDLEKAWADFSEQMQAKDVDTGSICLFSIFNRESMAFSMITIEHDKIFDDDMTKIMGFSCFGSVTYIDSTSTPRRDIYIYDAPTDAKAFREIFNDLSEKLEKITPPAPQAAAAAPKPAP